MTDPERWSEAGDSASEVERSLMRAGQAMRVPTRDKLQIWNGIVTAIPPQGVPPQGVGQSPLNTSVVGSLSLLKFGKAMSLLAFVSGLSWLGYQSTRDRSVPVRTAQPAATTQPAALPISTDHPSVALSVPPATAGDPRVAASAPAHTRASAAAPVSQLQEESLALLAARQALRSNQPAKAMNLLEQAQARFKPGMLAEERSALMVEALASAGNAQAASQRAKSFLQAYPKSPHAVDIRRFLLP